MHHGRVSNIRYLLHMIEASSRYVNARLKRSPFLWRSSQFAYSSIPIDHARAIESSSNICKAVQTSKNTPLVASKEVG